MRRPRWSTWRSARRRPRSRFQAGEAAQLYRAADRLGSSRAFALVGWRLVAFGGARPVIAGGYRLLETAATEGDRRGQGDAWGAPFFHPAFAPDTEKRTSARRSCRGRGEDGSVRGDGLLNLVRLEEDAYGLIPLDGVGEAVRRSSTSVARAAEDRRRDVLIWAHHVVANEDYHGNMIRRLRMRRVPHAVLCRLRPGAWRRRLRRLTCHFRLALWLASGF